MSGKPGRQPPRHNTQMETNMTPAEIRAARSTLSMTQAEFAKATGLSSQVIISRLETGRVNPSKTLALLIARLVRDHTTKGENHE